MINQADWILVGTVYFSIQRKDLLHALRRSFGTVRPRAPSDTCEAGVKNAAWRAAEDRWRRGFCFLSCRGFLSGDCAYMLCTGWVCDRLQRAVSGCVTADSNGWTLQAEKKNPCSLNIFISFCSHVRVNTWLQTSRLVRNQLLLSILVLLFLFSENNRGALSEDISVHRRYCAQDAVWSMNE